MTLASSILRHQTCPKVFLTQEALSLVSRFALQVISLLVGLWVSWAEFQLRRLQLRGVAFGNLGGSRQTAGCFMTSLCARVDNILVAATSCDYAMHILEDFEAQLQSVRIIGSKASPLLRMGALIASDPPRDIFRWPLSDVFSSPWPYASKPSVDPVHVGCLQARNQCGGYFGQIPPPRPPSI